MAAIALMGEFSNSRKRGRSPPLEDECTPISKRIAVLSLDGSLANKNQSQQNGSNHLPQPLHQHLSYGGDYSHSSSSIQQHPLVHQQEVFGQVQHNMQMSGLPYSTAMHHPHQNSFSSHHPNLINQQEVQHQNGGVFPGPGGGDMLRVFPYRPNIQNSPYYSENEVLYNSYLERTQRHGRTLHPSFYNKE